MTTDDGLRLIMQAQIDSLEAWKQRQLKLIEREQRLLRDPIAHAAAIRIHQQVRDAQRAADAEMDQWFAEHPET